MRCREGRLDDSFTIAGVGLEIAVFANPLTWDIPPYDPGVRPLALSGLACRYLEEVYCEGVC